MKHLPYSAADWGIYIGERIKDLHGTGSCEEKALDRALSNFRFRRNLRVDLKMKVAVVLSPSVTHDVATRRFFVKILERISQIPGHNLHSLEGVGASRFHCSGRRSKEGDDGIICSTRAGGNAWPNVMIEVGYSEPQH